ncbi:hypothetical protein Q9S78_08125 [Microbacterium sp. KSW-18]|uniref:Tryptophan-associated transmembrane protein n=1 Tax=Microbacterium aquilitoris TaxID=3067307 RepID=A0ABU3GIY9_9MICO|nr:hypothetical protein [Microbacterium sp. KSW-18]MDT3330637.1 hypothetical protein [Microbacterium sp. KSW-18]
MSLSPHRTLVAAVGTAAVAAYAVVLVLQICVWNPLAAVPGSSLAEIGSQAATRGESVFTPAPWVFAAIGVALAVAVLVLSVVARRTSTAGVAAGYLALIAAGAPAYFVASFGPGMALADAFGISGGDHAPGGSVLMVASGTAAVVIAVGGVALATSSRTVAPAIRV